MCRLLRGVFNLRPPEPKYTETWEVSKVTGFIKSWGRSLTLKNLTRKLAMLLALVLAGRSSDLVRLTPLGMRFVPEGVELKPRGLAKQTRPGKEVGLQPVVVSIFGPDLDLCPVQCLRSYIKATAGLRGAVQSQQQLFLSFRSPHKPVSSASIARWLRGVI